MVFGGGSGKCQKSVMYYLNGPLYGNNKKQKQTFLLDKKQHISPLVIFLIIQVIQNPLDCLDIFFFYFATCTSFFSNFIYRNSLTCWIFWTSLKVKWGCMISSQYSTRRKIWITSRESQHMRIVILYHQEWDLTL